MQIGSAAAAIAGLLVGAGADGWADTKYGIDTQTGQSRKVMPGWYIAGAGILIGLVTGFKGLGAFAGFVGFGALAVEGARYVSNKTAEAASQQGTQGLLPQASESLSDAFRRLKGGHRQPAHVSAKAA